MFSKNSVLIVAFMVALLSSCAHKTQQVSGVPPAPQAQAKFLEVHAQNFCVGQAPVYTITGSASMVGMPVLVSTNFTPSSGNTQTADNGSIGTLSAAALGSGLTVAGRTWEPADIGHWQRTFRVDTHVSYEVTFDVTACQTQPPAVVEPQVPPEQAQPPAQVPPSATLTPTPEREQQGRAIQQSVQPATPIQQATPLQGTPAPPPLNTARSQQQQVQLPALCSTEEISRILAGIDRVKNQLNVGGDGRVAQFLAQVDSAQSCMEVINILQRYVDLNNLTGYPVMIGPENKEIVTDRNDLRLAEYGLNFNRRFNRWSENRVAKKELRTLDDFRSSRQVLLDHLQYFTVPLNNEQVKNLSPEQRNKLVQKVNQMRAEAPSVLNGCLDESWRWANDVKLCRWVDAADAPIWVTTWATKTLWGLYYDLEKKRNAPMLVAWLPQSQEYMFWAGPCGGNGGWLPSGPRAVFRTDVLSTPILPTILCQSLSATVAGDRVNVTVPLSGDTSMIDRIELRLDGNLIPSSEIHAEGDHVWFAYALVPQDGGQDHVITARVVRKDGSFQECTEKTPGNTIPGRPLPPPPPQVVPQECPCLHVTGDSEVSPKHPARLHAKGDTTRLTGYWIFQGKDESIGTGDELVLTYDAFEMKFGREPGDGEQVTVQFVDIDSHGNRIPSDRCLKVVKFHHGHSHALRNILILGGLVAGACIGTRIAGAPFFCGHDTFKHDNGRNPNPRTFTDDEGATKGKILRFLKLNVLLPLIPPPFNHHNNDRLIFQLHQELQREFGSQPPDDTPDSQ